MSKFAELCANFSAPNTDYVLPHANRDEAIKWMVDLSKDRLGRGFGYRTFPFCWNVKAHNPVTSGHYDCGEFKNNPAYDDRWKAYCNMREGVFWGACEDAAQQFVDGEWTSYPGDDQGDWQFSRMGRSSGWMVLTKWQNIDFTGMVNPCAWFKDWSDDDLFKFYVGIVCLEHDLTPAKANEAVSFALADIRHNKEIEWEAEDKAAAEFEAKRVIQRKVVFNTINHLQALARMGDKVADEYAVTMIDLYKEIGGTENV